MSCDFTFSSSFCLICDDSTNFEYNKNPDSPSNSSNEAEELNLLGILCKWLSVVSNKINNNNYYENDSENGNEMENEQQTKSSRNLDKNEENDSSSSGSLNSFSSFFCVKCKSSVEKLRRVQQQIDSIKMEMSKAVKEILSNVVSSCQTSKDPTEIKIRSKSKNKIVKSKQREFLKIRQQICEYFLPSLTECKVETSDDDLTSDDDMNECKFEASVSNDYDKFSSSHSPSYENDDTFDPEFEEEESKPPILFNSPLLKFHHEPRFNLDSKSPTEFPKSSFQSPPKRKKKEIEKIILSPKSYEFVNKKLRDKSPPPPQKASSSSSIKSKPKLNQNAKKVAVSAKIYKILNQKLKDSDSDFPPFLVNHPKRDLIKIEGDGKYLYKNKFRFENIPGTAGQKCGTCQVLAKSFDAMLTHLREHEPNPPNRRIRLKGKPTSSYPSQRRGKRPLLTLDCGNGEFLTDGKYRFRKVEPESPISSLNSDPNQNGENGKENEKEKEGGAEKAVRFLCDTCGHYTRTRTQMSSHIRDFHAIPLHFVCQVCSREFRVKKNYESHMLVHSDTPAKICHICGRGFKRKQYLDDHLKEHENIRMNCPRENCEKTFRNNINLRLHLKHHDGLKNLQCTQCGKCFVRPKSLRNHITNFHDKTRFVCPVEGCGKKFKYRSNLGRHRRTVQCANKKKKNKNKDNNKK